MNDNEHKLDLIDDESGLTKQELKELKSLLKIYSAGSFIIGFVVALCSVGAAVMEIVHLTDFRGH